MGTKFHIKNLLEIRYNTKSKAKYYNRNNFKKGDALLKYTCLICGFTYDEEKGLPTKKIAPGTRWNDLPGDFRCPLCGTPKSKFNDLRKDIGNKKSPV